MKLLLYKSALCPRCYLAKKYLKECIAEHPQLELETIDIVTAPLRFLQDGIRSIPTLRIQEKTLAMGIPSRKRIHDFLEENQLL